MTDEKTYSQMRKEFQETYYKKLSPYLKNRDDERIKKKKLVTTLKICLLSAIILFFILTRCLDITMIIFLLGVSYIIAHILKKQFEREIKQEIMPYICKCIGNLSWTAGEYAGDKNIFTKSNLISRYNSSIFDDIFKGHFKDTNLEIIEAKFYISENNSSTIHQNNRHNRHNELYRQGNFSIRKNNKNTTFSGVIVKLTMNKNFQGNTVIKPDSIGHKSPSSKLKHTTLEDVQFEKKFDVFTDDEVEARYLITPSFMERLKNMQVAFKADKVSCAFYDKYLLVGLDTKEDLFSIGDLNQPLNDDKQFFMMFEEILSIIKLIDHFKLDQKIGM